MSLFKDLRTPQRSTSVPICGQLQNHNFVEQTKDLNEQGHSTDFFFYKYFIKKIQQH